MNTRTLASIPVLLGLLTLAAHAEWGGDINPGEGPKMVAEIQGDLVKLVGAPEAERVQKVASFLKRGGKYTIEAIKRFRNPELASLHQALLDHPDWHLQHRGLFALEYYGDPKLVLDRAVMFLQHPERRMREKAAITCLKLWDGRSLDVNLDDLLRDERTLHVRRCLEALKARIAGSLHVDRVSEEHRVTLENGLILSPFLTGMNKVKEVAPDYTAKVNARQGKGSASRLPTTDRWTWPLLGYGEEEVPGTQLQPFANLRQSGTVHHTGQDIGACLDGAGFYSPAAGVVMLIHTGSDMGTMIVVQHHLPGGRLVNSVYMHAGDTVFVKAGDIVGCGQLLGTMGMSFSIENGGHFAHLHFGLYPGAFDMRHNYGYKPVASGLADWYDPEAFLPAWMERTKPVVPDLYPPSAKLKAAVAKANKGEYGRAYADALRLRDRAERRSTDWADADEIVQACKAAPRKGIARAEALADGGYPKEALDYLKKLASICKGMPGVEKIQDAATEWQEDDDFKLAMKGQSKVEAAEKKALKEKDPVKVKKEFRKLLQKYGGTCLESRIREPLERLGG